MITLEELLQLEITTYINRDVLPLIKTRTGKIYAVRTEISKGSETVYKVIIAVTDFPINSPALTEITVGPGYKITFGPRNMLPERADQTLRTQIRDRFQGREERGQKIEVCDWNDPNPS